MGEGNGQLPYWQVNIPVHLRETECPAYLKNLSDKDRGIISTPDEDYEYMQWPQVKQLIVSNRIDLFSRKPTELRKYRQYTFQLIRDYGSIMKFVLDDRLKWDDTTPTGQPFTDPSDYKILFNDWPYGVDSSIAHLVVWTKFHLEDDPTTDDLTPVARKQIEEFVQRTFGGAVPQEDCIWFKNWRSLKSVHAIEHFHVMLNNAPESFLQRITGGDVPLAAKVGIAGPDS